MIHFGQPVIFFHSGETTRIEQVFASTYGSITELMGYGSMRMPLNMCILKICVVDRMAENEKTINIFRFFCIRCFSSYNFSLVFIQECWF
jgi:hypothetical protein